MKILRNLVYSNFFISVCALANFYYFAQEVTITYESIIVMIGTFVSYNLIRLISYTKSTIQNSKILSYYEKNSKKLILINIMLIPVLVYSAFFISDYQLINLLHLAFLVVIYEISSKRIKFGLRHLPYLKPLIIAYVWTMVCYGLSIESFQEINFKLFIESFIFISILSIPFDYKDSEQDKRDRIKSITHIFKSDLTFQIFLTTIYITFALFSYFYLGKHIYLYIIPIYLLICVRLLKHKSDLVYVISNDGLILIHFLIGLYFY